jgi:hypothetical protein
VVQYFKNNAPPLFTNRIRYISLTSISLSLSSTCEEDRAYPHILAGGRREDVEPIQTKKPIVRGSSLTVYLLYHLRVTALVTSFRMKDDVADLPFFKLYFLLEKRHDESSIRKVSAKEGGGGDEREFLSEIESFRASDRANR